MMRLNQFIKSVEWWKLVPAGLNGMKKIIANPVNIDAAATYVSAAAARDGSFLVAYIPPAHKGAIRVDLSVLSKPSYVYWFNPTDGRYLPMEASLVSNTGIREFVPPETIMPVKAIGCY